MFRFLGFLIALAYALGSAVLVWPAFFRLEQYFPLAQVTAFRAVLVLAYAVVAIIALLFMIPRLMRGFFFLILIVSIAAGATIGFGLWSRGLGPGALPDDTDQSVRVLTWNTAGEAVPAEEIARVIAEYGVDVASLPETSVEVAERVAVLLRDYDRPMWVHDVNRFPHIEDGPQAWQTTMLISPDLGNYSVIESSADGSSTTGQVPSAVVMPVSGSGPTIVAVHAVAPRKDDMETWRTDLRWAADQCPPEQNVILTGDFNATVDHMASLGTAGAELGACFDAAIRTGTGAVGTWPAKLPELLGAPIDHVLASRHWVASGSIVLPAGGSDHRALVVQLEPAD